jgi:cytochrome o ubiquinol oxidase operon protein cyoD
MSVAVEHEEHPLSYGKYVLGFVLSVVLTLAAYLLVTNMTHDKNVVVAVISCLAIVQFMIQMVFFLHIGDEKKPRWKRLVMWFMLGVVVLIVGGSLWIMNNLNYRMTPQQMEQYLKSQDAL